MGADRDPGQPKAQGTVSRGQEKVKGLGFRGLGLVGASGLRLVFCLVGGCPSLNTSARPVGFGVQGIGAWLDPVRKLAVSGLEGSAVGLLLQEVTCQEEYLF